MVYNHEQLKEHNKRRLKHGTPPLTLDLKIVESAQKWSSHLAKIGKMQHGGGR